MIHEELASAIRALPDTYMEWYSRLSPRTRDALHGREEARRKFQTRAARGEETLVEIARTYNVSHSTISRL